MHRIIVPVVAGAALMVSSGAAAQVLQVSYPGDAAMDCPAIQGEAARMDLVIADAQARIAKADSSAKGANLGAGLAVEGMLRTGLLARMPGAGQIANNAAAMARQRAEQVKAEAGEQIQTAHTRKALLGGLYSGKGCDAPPAVALASPESD
ncbi:MAG: hypothetical protein ACOY5Y_06705 [Pseudomonadota bacterium]|jgi:hypothetical protein